MTIRAPHLLFLASSFLLLLHSGRGETKSEQIKQSLEEKVAQAKLPGIVAAITSSKGVLALGSAGIRKNGSEEKLAENDVVHLGSCTKAMTSVLMATLVAEGKLSWETSLIAVLPELKDKIHPDHHTVTVWQLLTHRAGVEANAVNWWIQGKMELKARRLTILKENLKEAPVRKQGSYHYSNLGYLMAGCMAEKITGTTWEALMQKRIFKPLGMESAGFGPPGSLGKTDQPWGHGRSRETWNPKQFDNAQALGPAGRVHCTVADWAKFLAIQLPGGNKLGLNRKTLNKLITPTGNYAGGWKVSKRPWGKGTVLMHTGSNTRWYALVWVAPEIDRAFLVVTNSRDEHSHPICDQVIGKLIGINQGK